MVNTSFYVLYNVATGSETRFESFDDARGAVYRQVGHQDEWNITEFDNLREELARGDRRRVSPAQLIADGRGPLGWAAG